MKTQEYKDKNNDLQKYVGRKIEGSEILNICQSPHQVDVILLVIEIGSESDNKAYSRLDFYRLLDFPSLYYLDYGNTKRFHGVVSILEHHGTLIQK